MATKKSSTTKAKIKTTAAKTPAKSVRQNTDPKTVNFLKLRSLHMMSAGVFVLLALGAAFFMNNQSYQLTVSYMAEDLITGELAPAVRSVFDVELRWLLGVILSISAVLPALYLSRWEKKYQTAVTTSRNVPWRWVDFGITAALMVETVALLSGIQDIMTLKLVAGLVVLSLVLGLIAERQNDGAVRPAWATYTVGVVAGALPWVAIAVSAVSSVVYGGEWSPWYVYALYAVTGAGALALACIQFTNYRRKLAAWQQNYLLVERNYLAVNVLTKAAFATILIVAFAK